MTYIIISVAALVVAALTLFSGFGLGTILMPVFALFFPVPVAVAATAVVHLANNVFKVILIGRNADARVLLRFALPAAVAAMLGAWLLTRLETVAPLASYMLGSRVCEITTVRIVIAALIIVFSLFELVPKLEKLEFDKKYLPLGGLLSGFFGGLSGHQGALRSSFLIKVGLDKERFVGTSVMSAVIVDVSRLLVYGAVFFSGHFEMMRSEGVIGLVIVGTLAAFAGSFTGTRLLKKITLKTLQIVVGVMLLLLGAAMGAGIV